MAIGKMLSLAVAGPGRLELEWDDGHGAAVDLGAVIAGHPGLKPIRAARAFAKAALSDDGWSVEWPGGVDLGAPQLRRWADEQAGETMRADDFRAWMKAHALTLDGAASGLGLSRRMIAYYASGEKPIPKTVLLATEGLRARERKEQRADNMLANESGAAGIRRGRGALIQGSTAMSKGSRTFAIGRDAKSGAFIPVKEAKSRPSTTTVERMPKAGHGDTKRK